MASAVSVLEAAAPRLPARARSTWRGWRVLRHRAAWLLLTGWIVLPLLPALGLGLSVVLGVGLF